MKEYQNIYPALKVLYHISRRVQLEKEIDSSMSYSEYLREYCVIRCGTSRRGGHDYGIAKFLYKEDIKAVVCSGVTHRCNLMMLKGEIENYNKDKDLGVQYLFEISDFAIDGVNFEGVNCFIVNNSFLLSEKKQYEIFRILGTKFFKKIKSGEPVFIIFAH